MISGARHLSASTRAKMLTLEELVAQFGEPLVRRAAKMHGAAYAELRPEGTLKTLHGVHEAATAKSPHLQRSQENSRRHGSNSVSPTRSDDNTHHNNNSTRGNNYKNRSRSRSPELDKEDEYDAFVASPLSATGSQQGHAHAKPLTRDEFFEAKRQAAWAVAEEECQRLLTAVKHECVKQQEMEATADKANLIAENRLDHLRQVHARRMSAEKLQFASRLKKSIEGTRAVLQRVKEEGEQALNRFYSEQEREEEEKARSIEAFQSWQLEMKQRAERDRKEREERRQKMQQERMLQHWREQQAEQHQQEIQRQAEEKRRRAMSAKSDTGHRRYQQAIDVRQQQRKQVEDFKMEAAVDKLHELEAQERSAHERFKTYQQYKQQRGHETSSHVKTVQRRAQHMERLRQQQADERRRSEEARMRAWKENYENAQLQKRSQFDEERAREEEAYKRATAAEQDRKRRAAVVLQWLDARSQQQLTVLDQHRAVRQYEQHVINAANQRRADRAKKAQQLRSEQVYAQWETKMDQGDARMRQRREMSKRTRVEKERLAVMAQRMRWCVQTGKEVDMNPIDKVLQELQQSGDPSRTSSADKRAKTAQ